MKKHVKSFLVVLAAVLMSLICTACSGTRKITSDKVQQSMLLVVDSNQHTNQQSNDAAVIRTTEIDLSNIVIDFVKTEYIDGTTDFIATLPNNTLQTDTTKQRYREDTEPPNAVLKRISIKSITKGSIAINNDKHKQTDANIASCHKKNQSSTATQNTIIQTQTESQQIEKPRFSRLQVALMTLGVASILLIIYVVISCLRMK